MITLLEAPVDATAQGSHARTASILGRRERLESRNSTELGFASPECLWQMTSSNRRLSSRPPMGSISGTCINHQVLVKAKYPLFFPETWDSPWSQSYDQSFEVGSQMSFGADLLTLGKS